MAAGSQVGCASAHHGRVKVRPPKLRNLGADTALQSHVFTPRLPQRVTIPELMDDPRLDARAHRQARRGLARLNAVSGSSRLVWRAIQQLAAQQGGEGKETAAGGTPCLQTGNGEQWRIMDIACGGGDVTLGLYHKALREAHGKRMRVEVTGCDLSPVALQTARQQAAIRRAPVTFFELDALHDALPQGYDVLTSSLFLHHLSRPQAVELLNKMARAARHGIVVHDLNRSAAGLYLAHVATRVLTRSPVVRIDGPRSVRAAWTLQEARWLAAEAGLRNVRIERRWPERWVLTSSA